ncbi:UDP-N-acetylmuramate dehydrogenase [Undibacterium jejuense]|uniref:UDP-N-acetylenolpyruvoylglucosamine reductase n=1 Tax=Undibacterium jejuense TaxID=1344949 RepID=A0A923KQQ4_9BURK|nr:UDP-N-acetylmuramate dehydrogenase [Undibacterium jejuense]MBC3863294.1 UDP-N-acetylmuramate dehydrogenase [Undibacterium jejuense]
MTTINTLSRDVSLQKLNTFGIAAQAKLFLPVIELAQLQAVRNDPSLSQLPRLILGGGSNLVLSDQIDALVLHMCLQGKKLTSDDADFYYVTAAAGENWHEFVQWTLAQGWPGLENLSLIPGTVGAAPIQNIGAYGVEIQDVFHSLEAFDFATGEVVTLDKAACLFSYRDSIFKQSLRDRMVILNVTFALPKMWHPRLAYADVMKWLEQAQIQQANALQISQAIIAIRQAKLPDPQLIGNAGSFFKNPVVSASIRHALLAQYPDLVSYLQPSGDFKLAAGWLIEQTGWKGRSLGAAGVYEKQALVLVNRGHATGAEVKLLAQTVQSDVLKKFGVELEIEPNFY